MLVVYKVLPNYLKKTIRSSAWLRVCWYEVYNLYFIVIFFLFYFLQTLWCWAGRYGSDAADGDPQFWQQCPGVSERAAAAGPLL